MKIVPDIWLRSIFGHDVFRIVDFGTDVDEYQSLMNEISTINRAFFFVKVPINRSDVLIHFLKAGFRITEINITLEKLPQVLPPTGHTGGIVRTAILEDFESVEEIAGISFSNSRFHQDPHIPKVTADLIKRTWVENYFKGERGERILVTERDGKASGFLAITNQIVDNQKIGIIDLIGVHPDYRREGLGTQMIRYFVNDSPGKYDKLRVGTQLINRPSLNLYEKNGFLFSEAMYVQHAHVSGGKVTP